jgi:hypothetical protein
MSQTPGTCFFWKQKRKFAFWDRIFFGQISKIFFGEIQQARGPDRSMPTKRRSRMVAGALRAGRLNVTVRKHCRQHARQMQAGSTVAEVAARPKRRAWRSHLSLSGRN